MGTLWLALRADLSQRWRALLSLALLLGLIGGVVLTAAVLYQVVLPTATTRTTTR